jgi:hypothetical protein
VRAAVVGSRVAGTSSGHLADNLRTHTTDGSLLVRGMLSEMSTELYLVYTLAYDPDANGTLVEVRDARTTATTWWVGRYAGEGLLNCGVTH